MIQPAWRCRSDRTPTRAKADGGSRRAPRTPPFVRRKEAGSSERSAAASGRALVVGLSLGGYMAIETAEAYPDKVLGLVLAGCSAEPVGPSAACRNVVVPEGVEVNGSYRFWFCR